MTHAHKPQMPGMKKSTPLIPMSYEALRAKYKDALDPSKAPSKVTRLKSMSPEKRAEMERLYGSPKENK